jgi:hypothetical protein
VRVVAAAAGFSEEDVCAIAEFFCLHADLPPPPAAIYGPMVAVGTPTGGGQVRNTPRPGAIFSNKEPPVCQDRLGTTQNKNSKPKRWRFPQVYAPELFAAEGNVATVPGFVAIPTRIAELSAQLAASRQDLSVDAMKQKLRKLLGLPVELPHELAHYRILRCDSNRTPACMHALRGMLQSTARRN